MTILLDSAMGTELRRRGLSWEPPLWSARALLERRELVVELHRDNLRAGAQVITTNTFGLGASALATSFLAHRQDELLEVAVELACVARDSDPAFAHAKVAGSIAPVAAPQPEVAAAEYGRMARELAGHCDVLLLETFTSASAAALALRACRGHGRPVWLSFAVEARRSGEVGLIKGVAVDRMWRRLERQPPDALLANCFGLADLDAVAEAYAGLGANLPLGLCPHASGAGRDGGFIERAHEGPEISQALARVVEEHPCIVMLGGCCGTGPELVEALRARLPFDDATLRGLFT